MLCREIIAVCSQIHTKHINILCGQNVDLLNVKPVEHTVTLVLNKGWKSVRFPAPFIKILAFQYYPVLYTPPEFPVPIGITS
jgi:hypothetical protein